VTNRDHCEDPECWCRGFVVPSLSREPREEIANAARAPLKQLSLMAPVTLAEAALIERMTKGERPPLVLVKSSEPVVTLAPDTRASNPTWLARARCVLADLLRRIADAMEPA